MLEHSVMEYVKWFIALVSISFITVAVIFMFKLNEMNSFQQEVNYQIERYGGLTNSIVHEDTGGLLPLPYTQNGVSIDNYNDIDMSDPALKGYKREGALPKLNEYAKQTFGGCLTVSDEDYAPCLFAEDRNSETESTGFFVQEIKEGDDGKLYYSTRDVTEQARYGTTIKYVLTRQIGNVNGASFLHPGVIGESTSRVRGTVSE